MTINNEIRTKHQTRERDRLHFILNNIQRNLENYDKKENNKRK